MNELLIKELEKKFEEIKKEMGIKSSLEEIDRIFFIKDHILGEGYVSENLSRQICHRVVENYVGWSNYFHSLIMPNPQNMLNIGEAKLFNAEEKTEMTELMKKAMEISSRNSLIGLTKNKKKEAEFIDYVVKFWDDEFLPKLVKVMEKINMEWGK